MGPWASRLSFDRGGSRAVVVLTGGFTGIFDIIIDLTPGARGAALF